MVRGDLDEFIQDGDASKTSRWSCPAGRWLCEAEAQGKIHFGDIDWGVMFIKIKNKATKMDEIAKVEDIMRRLMVETQKNIQQPTGVSSEIKDPI